ncbi:MAG: hypothetical protein AAFP19_26785, partial [Bacteroidota bacterium]
MNVIGNTQVKNVKPTAVHWIWHALIWLVYHSICMYVFGGGESWLETFVGQLFFTGFNAGLVYFNAFYLMSSLLNHGRTIAYLLAVLVALVVSSFGIALSMVAFQSYFCQCDSTEFISILTLTSSAMG